LQEERLLRKIFYLKANLLAGFPDMAAGTLTAILIAFLMDHPISTGGSILEAFAWGAFWLVSPDLDIVLPILRRGFTGRPFAFDHHQTWLHWPVVMLPFAAIVTFFFFGPFWGVVACVNLCLHYVHDAVYMEDGVRWFFRLTRRSASRLRSKDAPKTPDEWIEANWLRPSRLSIYEILIGMSSLSVAAALASGNTVIGLIIFNVCWIGTTLFWWSYALLTGTPMFRS
jgi:hypothetical protein